MKIPSSSSVLLATLAISASSTTLAAPTGQADGASESGVVPSQSDNFNQTAPTSTVDGDTNEGPTGVVEQMGEVNLQARGNGMVSDILAGLPIVGPLAKALLVKDCPAPGEAGVQDVAVSEDELARLQSAVDNVSGALKGLIPLPLPALPQIPVLPVPLPSDALGNIGSMLPGGAVVDPLKGVVAGVAQETGTGEYDGQPRWYAPTWSASSAWAYPTDEAAAQEADPSQSDSSFLMSPSTTSMANAEEVSETPAPSASDMLSTDAGVAEATPATYPGATPSGPPNTPSMPEEGDPTQSGPDEEESPTNPESQDQQDYNAK